MTGRHASDRAAGREQIAMDRLWGACRIGAGTVSGRHAGESHGFVPPYQNDRLEWCIIGLY